MKRIIVMLLVIVTVLGFPELGMAEGTWRERENSTIDDHDQPKPKIVQRQGNSNAGAGLLFFAVSFYSYIQWQDYKHQAEEPIKPTTLADIQRQVDERSDAADKADTYKTVSIASFIVSMGLFLSSSPPAPAGAEIDTSVKLSFEMRERSPMLMAKYSF